MSFLFQHIFLSRIKSLASLAMLLLCFGSCTQVDLYERLVNIQAAKWSSTQTASFPFEIKDTAIAYKVYVVIRHTNNYAYRNIWLNVGAQQPGDSIKQQTFEIPLASAENWLGTGTDDIFEHRELLFKRPVRFSKKGEVVFTLQQTMRQDPLPGILQAGIRVEPVR
jgi:gliding motility-associated lipoprotein GldH